MITDEELRELHASTSPTTPDLPGGDDEEEDEDDDDVTRALNPGTGDPSTEDDALNEEEDDGEGCLCYEDCDCDPCECDECGGEGDDAHCLCCDDCEEESD